MPLLHAAMLAALLLAFGSQRERAPDNREHEREHCAAVAAADGQETHAPQDCMPIDQSLLDRSALGLPEQFLWPQMGGLLAYSKDQQRTQDRR